jgi:hypothetical protein
MPTKNLQWFQNRIVSQVSFITAIIAVLTAVVSIMWNIRVTNEMSKKMEKIEQNQVEQLIINTKLLTIIEMDK